MKYLILSLIACSSFARADILVSQPVHLDAAIMAAPTPIDSTPHLGYWIPLWDKGTPVTVGSLAGDWKLVGAATNAPCGTHLKDAYDPNGLKNADGTIGGLTFADFAGPKGTSVFGVKITHIGNKGTEQGPFTVKLAAPQFSAWGYVNGKPSHLAYWEYNCRQITDGKAMAMGCMLHEVLGNPPAGGVWSIDTLQCAASKNGVIFIYSR